MKRIISIFICIVLLGSLSVPAFCESEPNRKLYVRGPEEWETVYLRTDREDSQVIDTTLGTEMTREGDLYQQLIPNELTTFILSGNGTDTTEPISVDPYEDLYITVDEDGSVLVEYDGFQETTQKDSSRLIRFAETPGTGQDETSDDLVSAVADSEGEVPDDEVSEDDTRMLTINVPDSWTSVNIYTWAPEDFGGFPGSVVQKDEDAYKIKIKRSMVNLIISCVTAAGKCIQTNDIRLESNSGDVTVEMRGDLSYRVSYAFCSTTGRKPAAAEPTEVVSVFRVVGNANWMGNWEPDNDVGIMVKDKSGVYRKTFDNVEPGEYELKISWCGNWFNAYGGEEDKNFEFTLDQRDSVTVNFSIKDGIGTITVDYGSDVSSTDKDDDPSDVTEPTKHQNTDTTEHTTSRSTGIGDHETTETTETLTEDPDVSIPSGDGPGTDIENPKLTQLEPTHPNAGENDPADPEDNSSDEPVPVIQFFVPPNIMANLPVQGPFLFPFAIICVFAYLLILLAQRNKTGGDITPEGKVQRRAYLSQKAVAQAVKESLSSPPAKVDQAILEAIQKKDSPPTDP